MVFLQIGHAMANLYGECLCVDGIGGDFKTNDAGFSINGACRVEDEIPNAVVDRFASKGFDGL